jgi:hypothetical protein
MDQNAPYPDRFSRLHDAQGAVAKQRTVEAPALIGAIHGKPAQNRHRYRLRLLRRKRPGAAAAFTAPEANAQYPTTRPPSQMTKLRDAPLTWFGHARRFSQSFSAGMPESKAASW